MNIKFSNIEVGDIIYVNLPWSYQYGKVTRIEDRGVDLRPLFHFAVVDSRLQPYGTSDSCDASYCRKFTSELVDELVQDYRDKLESTVSMVV